MPVLTGTLWRIRCLSQPLLCPRPNTPGLRPRKALLMVLTSRTSRERRLDHSGRHSCSVGVARGLEGRGMGSRSAGAAFLVEFLSHGVHVAGTSRMRAHVCTHRNVRFLLHTPEVYPPNPSAKGLPARMPAHEGLTGRWRSPSPRLGLPPPPPARVRRV